MAGQMYYQKFDLPTSISNSNLIKIIDFYLINCPVAGKSHRGKTLQDYGFRGSVAFSALKKEMLQIATASLKENYKACKKDELEINFQKMESVSPPDEYCVFLKHDEKRVMNSLLSAIRNALAHGSFNVKAYNNIRIYFFMNHKDYTKAKIVLQERTLLSWIKIFQNGYSGLNK